jgi:hypothetical protein
MMAVQLKRRWFRFSLRAMLAVFTVVSLWLGWNVHVVRERDRLLAALVGPRVVLEFGAKNTQAQMSVYATDDIRKSLYGAFGNRPYEQRSPTTPCRISVLRRWLGDRPYYLIAYCPSPGPDVVKMHQAFPESIIAADTRFKIRPALATLSLVVIVREVVDCVLLAFVTTTLEDGCHDYNLPMTLYKGRMNTVYMSRLRNLFNPGEDVAPSPSDCPPHANRFGQVSFGLETPDCPLGDL